MTKFIEKPASRRSLTRRKPIYGIGINDAWYTINNTNEEGKVIECPYIRRWKNMLLRCYSKKYQRRQTTYLECTTVEEWHTFSTFRKWMEQQPWKGKDLDKDIILPGNKVYSPDTCCFVSRVLNHLVREEWRGKGLYPKGVDYNPRDRVFQASCNFKTHRTRLGTFSTPEEAHAAYVTFKARLITEAAQEQTDPRIKQGLLLHAALLTKQEY